jgi:hypothetical protein
MSLVDYESRVEAISRGAMPGEVEFWVTVIPSFQPEWGVGTSADGGHYFVTHVVFQRSLWADSLVESGPTAMAYDFSKPRVGTVARTSSISAELYQALRSEWNRSIDGARPAEGLGLDGMTYKFQSPGRCASTLSPGPETRNGKLVDLVMALARLADARDEALRAVGGDVVLRKLRELPTP